jgi:hypothetical protein
MVDISEEERRRYDNASPEDRQAMRVEFRNRIAKDKDKEKEQAKPQKDKDQSSKKKGLLERAADKAEALRGKADYIGAQAGRIKKAVAPAKKSVGKGRVPAQLRQHTFKSRSSRKGVRLRRPVYQQRPRTDAFADMINGHSRSTSRPMYDDMIYGAPSKRNDMEFMNDMMYGKPSKNRKSRDPFKDLLG